MNDMQTLANIAGMTAELIESGELVRVVRCKDCKFQINRGRKYPECDKHFLWAVDNWFCADGKRKEGL